MPNNTIEDWKKAAIVALYQKYGYHAIANRLGISKNTVRRYIEKSEEDRILNTSGVNIEVRA